MNFNKKVIITGLDYRTKADNTSYVLLHVLTESGQTIACMYRGDNSKLSRIEKLKEYDVEFVVNVGKYTNLNISDVKVA